MVMSYRTRSARRLAKKSKRNFFLTFLILAFIVYATLSWVLPSVIGGVGFISHVLKPPKPAVKSISDSPILAPPVLNIPYEATNSAKIDIRGYSTAEANVKLFLDDEEKDIVKVSSDGSFVFKNIDLNIGINNIYGKTIDEKGTESLSSKTIKLIFDNEKPKLEVTEPSDGVVVKGERKIKISGKTEPDAQVFINGSQIPLGAEGNFSSDFSLSDGENHITIKSQDRASNSTEIARTVRFEP